MIHGRRPWHPSPLLWLSFALHLGALAMLVWRPAIWLELLVLLLVNHLVLTLVGLWPRSQALGPNWRRLPWAAVEAGQIALTIDDGPDPNASSRTRSSCGRISRERTTPWEQRTGARWTRA